MHNIDDFSLVSSQYKIEYASLVILHDVILADGVVYISLRQDSSYKIFKISTTTRNMIMAYQADSGNEFYFKPLLHNDGHVNVLSRYYDGAKYHINHIQIPSNENLDIPSYTQESGTSFSTTTDLVYNFTSETFSFTSYTANVNLSDYNNLNIDNFSTIEIDNDKSFWLSLNDTDYEPSFVLSDEQIHLDTSSIP